MGVSCEGEGEGEAADAAAWGFLKEGLERGRRGGQLQILDLGMREKSNSMV